MTADEKEAAAKRMQLWDLVPSKCIQVETAKGSYLSPGKCHILKASFIVDDSH